MSYDGHVDQDGEWIERVDGPVLIRKVSVGEMDNNVYLVACHETGAAVLVDAADRADRLREVMAGFDVLAVLQTHGHWDHVRAWADLQKDPGLPVWGHAAESELFPEVPDRELEDDDVIGVGNITVEVIHTPGHTPGSLQFLVRGEQRPHLISGDSLFPGGPGNTWGDPAKFTQLMDNLEERIFGALPDETWVYPGHGDDTTLGAERDSLAEWRERGW